MRMRSPVILALSLVAGCQQQMSPDELPGYHVTIPADVPQQYVVTDKVGQQFVVDGPTEYRWAHGEGWADCWRRHQRGQLDPQDESLEPVSMQETALAAQARTTGFHACRQMLLQAQKQAKSRAAANVTH